MPRSRGGESSWENVVTACAPCNLRKGDRLLEESGLVLTRLPKAPAPELFIQLSTPTIPRAGSSTSRTPLPPRPDVPGVHLTAAAYHDSEVRDIA